MNNTFRQMKSQLSALPRNFQIVLGVAVVYVLWAVFISSFGGIIPIANGFGWDGSIYGTISKAFSYYFEINSIDSGRFQRVLPSAIVHYGWKLVGVQELTDAHIIRGFKLLNVTCALLSFFLAYKIANVLNFSRSQFVLLLFSLFGNVMVLRMYYFNPVLTDASTYLLAIFLIYASLRAEFMFYLLIIVVLGYFTNPAISYTALIVFVFRATSYPQTNQRYWLLPTAVILFLAVIAWAWYNRFSVNPPYPASGRVPTLVDWVWLSVLCSIVYLGYMFYNVLSRIDIRNTDFVDQQIQFTRMGIAALLILGLQYFVALKSTPGGFTTQELIDMIQYSAVALPGLYVLDHLSGFGPSFVLFLFFFPAVSQFVLRRGLGVTCAFLLGCGMSIFAESRVILTWWPMFAVFTCAVVPSWNWKPLQWWVYGITAFILSRVYYPLSSATFDAGMENYIKWPAQHYFSNYGFWFGYDTYMFFLILFLLIVIVFWRLGLFRPAGVLKTEVHSSSLESARA